jgi:hypothetical protein
MMMVGGWLTRGRASSGGLSVKREEVSEEWVGCLGGGKEENRIKGTQRVGTLEFYSKKWAGLEETEEQEKRFKDRRGLGCSARRQIQDSMLRR